MKKQMGPGGAAAIHASRAKKLKGELDRIEAALNRARVVVADGDASTADRVDAALLELVERRRRLDDLAFDHPELF